MPPWWHGKPWLRMKWGGSLLERGPGSTYGHYGNWFYSVFWKRRVKSISCFLSHQKILILAKVITDQRSALTCNSIAHEFQSQLPDYQLQNLSSPRHFLRNHSETFRIYSRHENKDSSWSKFWFKVKHQTPDHFTLDHIKFGPTSFWKIDKVSEFCW